MLRSFSVLAIALLSSCAHSPHGRSQLLLVGSDRVNATGVKEFSRIKFRESIVTDKDDNAFVSCVVQALANQTSTKDWEVVIFRADEANAFALPGNKIGVNSGLLRVAVNQDQLAAVIGHEMGHVIAEHGRERMSQEALLQTTSFVGGIVTGGSYIASGLTSALEGAAQIGILYPFNQIQENEADLIGLELSARAGFQPGEAVEFWKNMDVYSPPDSTSPLSAHPTTTARIENIESHLPDVEEIAKSVVRRPSCDQ
jgi:predicted Zn-dependent protease